MRKIGRKKKTVGQVGFPAPYELMKKTELRPVARKRENGRFWAASVSFSALIILGCVAFGLLLRGGQIFLPATPSEEIGTQQKPVKPGNKCTLESMEKDTRGQYVFCRSRWAILEVLRGEDANRFVREAAGGYREPDEGKSYFVMRFEILLLNADTPEKICFQTDYFTALSPQDGSYTEMAEKSGGFPPIGEGETAQIWAAFCVPVGESPIVMYQAAQDKAWFFSAE